MNKKRARAHEVPVGSPGDGKPDSPFALGPCTLELINIALIELEGTSESGSQDGKQVVFDVHNIAKKGEMNCSNDYAKYSTNKMAEMVLATFTLQLIVTMNSGFGYAMGTGEFPAGVQKARVLAQYMHGARLCNGPASVIVFDRKMSCTKPSNSTPRFRTP